jgi:class 3 adenylate cyclase
VQFLYPTLLYTLSVLTEQGRPVAETDSAPIKDLERRLATILSADVAAYSRLMAEDEEQTLRTFREHAEVFQKLVALHRGRVFNTAGDAILAEFGSAVEAVRYATEIQAALRTRNDHLPEERQVRFRIGVNLGDVMVQGQDLLGDGVNVAARLQSAAEPGGICISGSVYDQIRNKLSLGFKPLGDMSFKNIPQAVRTFAIAEAEGLGLLPSPDSDQKRRGGGFLKWAAAAAVLLLLASGAVSWTFWEQHQEAQLAAQKLAAERARQRADVARQEAAAARRQADVERQKAEEELVRLAEAERARANEAQSAPAMPEKVGPPAMREASRSPPPAPSEAEAAKEDGQYGGEICYGPSSSDPARCFKAQATVEKGKISGQWPGRDPSVTMYLVGDVSPAGDVTIHMRAEKADGSRVAAMNLTGTLRDGRLDATGAFLNGRKVTLNWHKS